MKATKTFSYHVDGNHKTIINEGDDIPEVAQEYAVKNELCEVQASNGGGTDNAPADEADKEPVTEKPAPVNKSKQPAKRQVKSK